MGLSNLYKTVAAPVAPALGDYALSAGGIDYTKGIVDDVPKGSWHGMMGEVEVVGAKASASTAGTAAKVAATGQKHHLLSNKIMNSLNTHPTLKGVFRRGDPRYIYNATDEAAHNGYQTWHRQYDEQVTKWLDQYQSATPEMFKKYLHDLYQEPWLQQRIPNVNLIQ